MTRARSAVLAAVDGAVGPVPAADVRRVLGEGTDLVTVYRALHWLVDQGLIEEFAFACEARGVERYYVSRRHPHGHFFHCEGCHRFLPVEGCFAEDIGERLEKERGFRVTSHTLYFQGLCPDCAEAGPGEERGREPGKESGGRTTGAS